MLVIRSLVIYCYLCVARAPRVALLPTFQHTYTYIYHNAFSFAPLTAWQLSSAALP